MKRNFLCSLLILYCAFWPNVQPVAPNLEVDANGIPWIRDADSDTLRGFKRPQTQNGIGLSDTGLIPKA
jgi:hypothetical protein